MYIFALYHIFLYCSHYTVRPKPCAAKVPSAYFTNGQSHMCDVLYMKSYICLNNVGKYNQYRRDKILVQLSMLQWNTKFNNVRSTCVLSVVNIVAIIGVLYIIRAIACKR